MPLTLTMTPDEAIVLDMLITAAFLSGDGFNEFQDAFMSLLDKSDTMLTANNL